MKCLPITEARTSVEDPARTVRFLPTDGVERGSLHAEAALRGGVDVGEGVRRPERLGRRGHPRQDLFLPRPEEGATGARELSCLPRIRSQGAEGVRLVRTPKLEEQGASHFVGARLNWREIGLGSRPGAAAVLGRRRRADCQGSYPSDAEAVPL